MKKGNQWHLGMKCHTGVDAGSGFVHTVEATAANVHDVTVAARLLREDDKAVYGDSAYLGIEKREEIKRVMMVPATVNKGTFIYLQSLGRAFASTAISMVREVLFGVGFALLLPLRFGLDGALYSMPVSDLLTFAICLAAILYTYQTLNSSGARTPRLCGN